MTDYVCVLHKIPVALQHSTPFGNYYSYSFGTDIRYSSFIVKYFSDHLLIYRHFLTCLIQIYIWNNIKHVSWKRTKRIDIKERALYFTGLCQSCLLLPDSKGSWIVGYHIPVGKEQRGACSLFY